MRVKEKFENWEFIKKNKITQSMQVGTIKLVQDIIPKLKSMKCFNTDTNTKASV